MDTSTGEISPNYVAPQEGGKTRKVLLFLFLVIAVLLIGVFLFVSSRDTKTYSFILNCESNIKKNLVAPDSFNPISVSIVNGERDSYAIKYEDRMQDGYIKDLIINQGYAVRSKVVLLDFDSTNKFNANIREKAICRYFVVFKDDHDLNPKLSFLAIGNNAYSEEHDDILTWMRATERFPLNQNAKDLWMTKFRYLMTDVEVYD